MFCFHFKKCLKRFIIIRNKKKQKKNIVGHFYFIRSKFNVKACPIILIILITLFENVSSQKQIFMFFNKNVI